MDVTEVRNSLTVEEALQKKIVLENTILGLFQTFTKETGMAVKRATLNIEPMLPRRYEDSTAAEGYRVWVTVEVGF